MKNTIFAIAASVFMLATLVSCEEDTLLTEKETPQEIQTYVSTHFPENAIIETVKEEEHGTTTYDVLLEGNISLDFSEAYEVTDIDGVSKLPDSVIPEKLLAYVAANYPDNFITDWELDGKNQQIELNNNLELLFNMAGELLRIDK